MPAEDQDKSERKLCSVPLCGATADWFTDFFGETEYYCGSHKPIIPHSLLKRVHVAGKGGLVRE
jgi:hypothetical protein